MTEQHKNTTDTHTETQKPSPVAEASKPMNKRKMLFLMVIGIGLVYFIFGNQENSKPEELKPKPMQAEALKAPTAQAEPIKVIKPELSPDEINAQIENEKLQKIRVLAPGTMYADDESKTATAHNTNADVLGNNSNDNNAQFMSRVSSNQAPVVMATRLKHPSYTLAQGTLIWATLETQIVSDLPGMVRAVTSQNIYAEDGNEILLPRGSRLVGQYTSSVTAGQQRVFVVWQRAIRPDHIDIQLNSPGTDTLGTAGLPANGIDHHFWSQFGNALLLSVIGAGTSTMGVNNAQDQFNSAAAYREALAGSFSESASNSFESTGSIKPTIYVNQGNRISVFVARDLDFFNELKAS